MQNHLNSKLAAIFVSSLSQSHDWRVILNYARPRPRILARPPFAGRSDTPTKNVNFLDPDKLDAGSKKLTFTPPAYKRSFSAGEMSLSAASKCPFIAQVSTNFLQKSGSSRGRYGQKCPVMSKLFHTVSRAANGGGKQPLSLGEHSGEK